MPNRTGKLPNIYSLLLLICICSRFKISVAKPYNYGRLEPERNLYRQDEDSEEETAVAATTAPVNGTGTGAASAPANIDAFTMFFTQVLPALRGLLEQFTGNANPVESAFRQFQELSSNTKIDINFGIDLNDVVKMVSKVLPPPLATQFVGLYRIIQSHIPKTTTSRNQYISNLSPSRYPSLQRPSYAAVVPSTPPNQETTTFLYYPEVVDVNVGSVTGSTTAVDSQWITDTTSSGSMDFENLTKPAKDIDIGSLIQIKPSTNEPESFTKQGDTFNFETLQEQTEAPLAATTQTTTTPTTTTAPTTTTTITTTTPTPTKEIKTTRRYRIRTTSEKIYLGEEDEEAPEITVPTEAIEIHYTLPVHLQVTQPTTQYTTEPPEVTISPAKLQSLISKYQYTRQKTTTGSSNFNPFENPWDTDKQEVSTSKVTKQEIETEAPPQYNAFETTFYVHATVPSTNDIDLELKHPTLWNSKYESNSDLTKWKEETSSNSPSTAFDPYQAKYQHNLPRRTTSSIIETSTPVQLDLESMFSSGSHINESWRRKKPPRRIIPSIM